MRRLVCSGILAASLCAAAPRPAEAWGGGFLFGTVLGLTTGAVVGSALVHPYPYPVVVAPPPPYAYPPPAYAYGYPPPYAYPVPYGYGYPPPGPAPTAGYAPSGYQGRTGYAAVSQPAPATPACGTGQFFNKLTGNCDRR